MRDKNGEFDIAGGVLGPGGGMDNEGILLFGGDDDEMIGVEGDEEESKFPSSRISHAGLMTPRGKGVAQSMHRHGSLHTWRTMLMPHAKIEERQRINDSIKHHQRDRNRAPSEPAGKFDGFTDPSKVTLHVTI